MKRHIIVPAMALLALFSGHAAAFEQQQGASPARTAPAKNGAESTTPAPQAEFATPSHGAGEAQGTEITIPGLGKLGVLPKMDFGLELLYGAEPERVVEEPREQDDNADDLRIRGTIKHQF